MGKYSTEQAAGAQRIETLGGGYALKWDDETLRLWNTPCHTPAYSKE